MGKKSQTVKKRQCLHCGHSFECSSKQLKSHARSCKPPLYYQLHPRK